MKAPFRTGQSRHLETQRSAWGLWWTQRLKGRIHDASANLLAIDVRQRQVCGAGKAYRHASRRCRVVGAANRCIWRSGVPAGSDDAPMVAASAMILGGIAMALTTKSRT